MMEFTYDAYRELIKLLKAEQYEFIFFNEAHRMKKSVLLRHDIDMSLDYAYEMAKIEYELNVKSTYFVLISTDFYNIFSIRNREIIQSIINMGHHIQLHFDASAYGTSDIDKLQSLIENECKILESVTNVNCYAISFHRPVENLLRRELSNNLVSTYEKRFFDDYKYISDSRISWRENPINIIKSGMYQQIQCLIHPFGYKDICYNNRELIDEFLKDIEKRYLESLNSNIRDFENFIN